MNSRYTREIHTPASGPSAVDTPVGVLRHLRRKVRFWNWIATWAFRNAGRAEERMKLAARLRYGRNPRYNCDCGDCWLQLVEDIVEGRVEP